MPVAGAKKRRSLRQLYPSTTRISADTVFTIDEIVIYLKLPKSTAYKLAQEGKIPGKKVGRHWRFHKEAIDNWLIEGHAFAQKVRDRE